MTQARERIVELYWDTGSTPDSRASLKCRFKRYSLKGCHSWCSDSATVPLLSVHGQQARVANVLRNRGEDLIERHAAARCAT